MFLESQKTFIQKRLIYFNWHFLENIKLINIIINYVIENFLIINLYF